MEVEWWFEKVQDENFYILNYYHLHCFILLKEALLKLLLKKIKLELMKTEKKIILLNEWSEGYKCML